MMNETKQIGTKLDKYVNNEFAFNQITNEWDNEYNIGEITDNHEFVQLDRGILVLMKTNDELLIDFFLIEEVWSSDDFPKGFGNIIFYGYGFSGNLKEMRHTYFNPYLFYINATLIEESFKELRKYFEI